MYVHTIDFSGKERRLISSGAGTDLNDNVLVVIRVFRKEEDLQLLLQLLDPFSRLVQLFFRQFTHLLI